MNIKIEKVLGALEHCLRACTTFNPHMQAYRTRFPLMRRSTLQKPLQPRKQKPQPPPRPRLLLPRPKQQRREPRM